MRPHLRKYLRSSSSRFIVILATLLSLLTILSEGFAVDVTSIVPQWQAPTGSSGAPTCLTTDNASTPVTVRYGDDDLTNPPCPAASVQSGFGFTAGSTGTFTNGTPFILGQLTHFNNQVFASSLLTGARLNLTFTSNTPVLPPIDTQVALDETANNLSNCPYGDPQPCADRVTITPAAVEFNEAGTDYQLEILGIIPGSIGTCTYNQADLRLSFISDENSNNSGCLFGRVTIVSDAVMQIEKTTTATELQPGDVVDYQIDYTCASTTSTCNGVQLVDFLPDELIYVGSSGSTHTVSPTGSYSTGGNTVTFNFIDPLPAGSTGYVRVRARVRNDGTLTNGQTITNTGTSTQTNGPTTTSSVSLPVTTTSDWEVTKAGDGVAFVSTEPPITDMTYSVAICPNGSNVNLLNAQMVDTLPAGAEFVSASGGGVYNAGANTVTWTLGDLSITNGCNTQTVVVRFPPPTFAAGNSVLNTVTGTGTIPDDGPFNDTADVTRILQTFVPAASIQINKNTTRTDYVVGAEVDYFLTTGNTGNTNLYNMVMTDDLPDAFRTTEVQTGSSAFPMVVEYAINGSSTYTTWANVPAGSNSTLGVSALGLQPTDWITSIRWRFNPGVGTPPGWTMGSRARITGTITSPDRNGVAIVEADQINNNARLDWEYLPGGVGDCSSPGAQCGSGTDGATIDVVPIPVPVFDKVSGGGVSASQRFIIGQQVGYFDLTVDNNTGIGVDNFVLTDSIPAAFNVTSVNVGNYNEYTNAINLRYQASDNPGVWVTWPGSPFAEGTTVNTSALGLPAGIYISRLEFNYGSIPMNFEGYARIMGETLETDRDGATVADGDNMVNNASMDWEFMGVPNNRTDSTTNPIHGPTVTPAAAKSTTTNGPYIPTSAVGFRLTFGAGGDSPSNVLNNPVVADLLPANVNYVSYTYNANGTGLAAPTFEQIADYNGTGRTLVRWRFTGTLTRGQTAFIDLNTTLSAGTPSGSLANTFAVIVDDMPTNGGTPDAQDLDGDGQTTDTIITATTSIPVEQLIGLDSQKRVRGQLDTAYSVFPSYGHTVPNGSVDYRLTIINRGNIPVNNVRVIDILPFVGDTGVQDTRPRNSAWRPVLTGPVTPQSGVTIYYSTATNPCRPQIIPSGPAGCTSPNWSLVPPANLDTVRSLRFDFAGTMAPGQSFTFNWSMRAPATAVDESIAWNSFAFTSTNAITGVPLRPAEPNKVGIILDTTPLTSLITLKKYTNTEDADLAPGPYIPLNGTVTWRYDVTNIGQTRLGNVTLTDNVEGTITCPQATLEPNESMTCTLVSPNPPQIGQYANTANVIGTAIDAGGTPIDGDPVAPGTQLVQPTSTDPSHYYGYDPLTASIGDYTWIDLDYNGQQDVGEPPLGGVTVRLLDSSGNPVDDPSQAGIQDYVTTTDANGFYNFVNLPAGNYIVEFEIPSAYSLTLPNVAPDATDSDANITTGRTGVIPLAVDEHNTTVDAGYIAYASLGDRIWMDTNGNGIQDAAETATPALLEGLQVLLLDSTGTTTIATTYTDAGGNYLFDNLLPGDYIVQFPLPPTGYVWTALNAAGSTATNDSDVILATRRTVTTSLQADENDPSWDAGLVTLANIGNFVWSDTNFNGRQDAGEPGVAGVTVRLLNSSGTQATDDNGVPIPDTTTNASGAYSFTNLRPQQYAVRFTLPTGYIFTTQDAAGSTDANDSDAVESGVNIGQTIVTTLDPSETDNTWDAGLIQLASLGNFVWQDTNNNGQQDGGEPGVAGAIVTLLDSTGTPVTTDALGNAITPITTPASGAYSFTNLDPRISYIVQFERPANYVFATPNTGADATDSDAVVSNLLPVRIAHTGTITLTAGQNDTTIDAGLVQAASIGNYVFYDNNNNGQQDAGDAPVQGVTVRLLNAAGNQATDEQGTLIPDLVTDANGLYQFTNLIPGTYSLYFSTLPATYTFAQRDIGSDVTDSDPNRFTGRTITTVLAPNETDLTWDTGLVVAAALGDFVWIDTNANGQQDGGEAGLAGVTVRLLDGSNNPIDNPNTAALNDAYTATTDVNGNYSFVGLPPNLTYRVRFDRPAGYVFTAANTGADATDSDGVLNGQTNVATVTTNNITTLTPGTTDNTWDQGVLLPSALGDYVWRDNNDDGLQTGGEPAISGVTVRLLDSAGAAVDDPNTNGTQAYTATTNASGLYSFTNLYPGTYIVEFVTPTGYKRADYFVGGGTNAATDSDMQTAGVSAGRTPTITLPYNTTDNTWDAGFVPLATIGNFVWRDNDNDGVQDVGEPGVAGATVTLLDSTGTAVTTDGMGNAISPIVTTGTGAYSFTNLDPDIDYIVQFTLPTPAAGQAGYKFSPQDVGADTTDSDADTTTGRTAVIPLNPGQTDNDRDAGLTPLAQLGNYVWNDLNGDGVQGGAGELGINNVTVELFLSSNLVTPIATTTTGNNPVGGAAGYYQFLNLDAGTYAVRFTLPSGYVFTRQDAAAATDATDSDANRFTGFTGSYTLAWGGSNQTIDAGIVQPASLGDYVWYDTDDDGIQDVTEVGQNGVVVRLLDAANNPIDDPNTPAVNDAYVLTTANNPVGGAPGYYVFQNLLPGDYRVQFDLPASTLPQPSVDYVLARQNQGGDDALDSDPDRATGITATINLSANENDMTNDAGILLRGANLGNRVWIDLNNNGIQDGGEVGLNGVTVTLLNGSGGTDIDPITPGTQTLSTVTAFDATVGNGYYQFTELVPGTYIVQVTLPAGYQFSPQNQGGDDTVDSDVNLTTGRTAVITVAQDGDDQTWDAGVVPLASIGDYVWRDNNNDGLQTVGEPALAGVVVRLLDTANNPVDNPNVAGFQAYTYTTVADGAYLFNNLPPDVSYVVQFDLPATGYRRSPVDANGNTNDATDSDANLTTGRSPATLLSPNEFDNTVDAGFVPLATIGDYVWIDTDGDGVQDAGEVGLNGVTVNLYDAANLSTILRTTTTANNPVGGAPGYYQFSNLDAGSYVVEFVQPVGYIFTNPNINSAATTPASTDANDSDADRYTGRTGTYVLNWGDSVQTVDAGVLQPAALGNYVWVDTNDNGVQDGGELGLDGVTVHLLDSAGNPVDNPNTAAVGDAYTVTTAGGGAYAFTGLLPGTYSVQFDLPNATYVFARQDAAAATDATDSDANRTTGRTGNYTLIANQTDNTVDAGMLLRASLGDYVWIDTDGDGVQDGGETGVQNVTVTLYDGTGAQVDNPNTPAVDTYVVQTDVNGAYLFNNLIPGDYYLVFTLPSGYIFTRQDAAAATDATDSDANRFNGRTITTALISGENDLTWDAGILQPAALGNYVWVDTNDNGVQDGGELGLDGVTVHLLDNAGNPVDNPNTAAVGDAYTVTTAGGGAYAFTGLFPGVYAVQFDLPNTTYAFARQDAAAATDATDSDADRTTGRTGNYTLIANQTDNTVDAGVLARASLGDFVWNDVNGNGVQDGAETGVQNVTVTLYDGTGAQVDNPNTPAVDTYVVQTDVNGAYLFNNLIPGDYYVVFTLPSGYIFTRQDAAAATDLTDSDADRFNGRTITTALISGENDLTWDAGILQPAALGNYVWVDTNDNGVQDGGELGLDGVTVHLLDNAGNPVDNPNTAAVGDAYTVTTAGGGAYAFTGLFPGVYAVEFVLPGATDVFARQNQGGDDTLDSDADRTTGRTGNYTLIANQTDNTVDAGVLARASLGDFVWNDVNGNGVQDGGETGVQNVTVTLYDGTGAQVDNPNTPAADTYVVQTDVNGAYLFNNLIPGDYYVVFTLPSGYIFTRQDAAAATDATDSDADRFNGRTITTALISGENDLTWDAGILQPAALGNFVWIDTNDNGVQDSGETGLAGVTVRLLDNAGNPVNDPNNPVATPYVVTTDVNGAYAFTGLLPGDYAVQFDLPSADYVFARQAAAAATDATDSDANRTTGRTGNYTLIANQTDNTVDAGMMQRASIGNFVWLDMNDNGIQDSAETGLAGVTVNLTDENAVMTTTTTLFDGSYLFDNLVPGNYSLQFVLPSNQYEFSDLNQGSDPALDSDANITTGSTVITHLTSNEDDMTWDAGIVPLASIGDRVWIDINNNGVQDGGEADYVGATVNLLNSSGTVIATTTTNATGNYLFDRLSPGQYAVQVVLPTGYQFSPQDVGGADASDSDVNTTTGRTITTTLIPGENDLSWDAGLVPLVSIGNYVWVDMNNDGVQDGAETGASGVTVNLLNSAGTIIATTTTNATGNYLFNNLPPDDYRVEFVLPAGYQFSPPDAGGDDSLDSDANPTTGRTILVNLPPGTNDLSRDAGIVPLTSIGNFVWRDNNGDGIQDAGEPGIAGITVQLHGGPTVLTTTTDVNGNYLFNLLPPGNYYIEVVVPNDYAVSPLNAGGDTALDNDIDPATNRSVTTTLIPDEDDMTWDVGLAPLANIGDRVWVDANADGIQDAGENGLAGITVNLLDAGGNLLETTTTDTNGLYLFDNLRPGDYIIEVILPADSTFSPMDAAAATDATDSDVDPTTGRTIAVNLGYGEIDLTWDAGIVPLGSIGDYVWNDTNANGIQDAGEAGIPNVTVNLTDSNGVTISVVTDSTGHYLFTDLLADSYTITVDTTTLPAGMGQTYDLNGTLDHSATYTLGIGEDVLTVDFGYVLLGSIGDTIWVDNNRNGIQDGSEPGIPNVTVTLVLPDGSTLTTTTDANGNYSFTDLYPGDYRVVVDLSTIPSTLLPVFDPDGTFDGWTDVTLSAGEQHITADFGYAPPIPPGPALTPTPVPTADTSGLSQGVGVCTRGCVDWQLYHSNQTGDWEIFRLDKTGDLDSPSISTNLSQGEDAEDMAPTRSPNAEWIVFSSNRDGNWELYLASTDGDRSKTRRLTYNTFAHDTDPVWGPNNYVVYETTRDGNWELYLLDMTTGRESRLTNNAASDINAYWSSDGKSLLFQSDRSGLWQIYRYDLATGQITRLSDGTANDVDPQYSNNDGRIAFRSYRDGAKSTLYLMNSDGSGLKRISDVDGDATNQSWSTNDSLIAYQSDLDGDLDIYIYQVGTGITRKLTENTIPDYAPTWLCNGTIVVFTSDIDGNPNIFDADALAIKAPAIDVQEEANRLTTDPADDIYPENSPVEENASREGRLPGINLGAQTDFLIPDVTVTDFDPSLDTGRVIEPIDGCGAGSTALRPTPTPTPTATLGGT
ncbi:MAG: carboxypeptidase regulatory-like domain-containing protein [Chloroflexi bacterium]|nr:carboxypeptidase regulatory-like domain-containing protein [Chloroflexota bacterium]